MRTASYGVSWNDGKTRLKTVAVAMLLAAMVLAMSPARQQALSESAQALVRVLVQRAPGTDKAPERAIEAAGGHVVAHADFVNAVVADVPEGAVAGLERAPGVASVYRDRRVQTQSNDGSGSGQAGGTSLDQIRTIIGANGLAAKGVTGAGVDVALIDSGVAPVPALSGAKVMNAADISPDYPVESQRFLDSFGHGTHMAGIIAGRDDATGYKGIAPDARIVNVKAADHTGQTTTIQLLLAVGWTVQHRYDNGMNIRVINLSFGADGSAGYLNDPLAVAIEYAWRSGIVVVSSAGNTGLATPKLTIPAADPYGLAVGAVDTNGTVSPADDVVPAWSSPGDDTRHPDLVAPGKSVLSLRDPGSFIDSANPNARSDDANLFRGSGTSQAAAVVSGAVALLLQQRPSLTPDQVKAVLTRSAAALPAAAAGAQGNGLINLAAASAFATPSRAKAAQAFPPATYDWTQLTGGQKVSSGTVGADGSLSGNTWSGNTWSGNSWSGNTWSGNSWSGNSWSGNTWSGNSWSGNSWSGADWGA